MSVSPPAFELVLSGGPAAHQFTAYVPDEGGGRAAEHTFDWRSDSTALALNLGALARAAISGHPPQNDLHCTFGQRLYQAVLAGPVGELWQARLAERGPLRLPLRLVLRVDPRTARPLLNLPWEYLHDGRDFLALNWRTPISRRPWGLDRAAPLPALDEPLRLLVLVAAPLGLGPDQVLNVRQEEDLILGALAGARRGGQVQVEYTPDGSLETLERLLREFDPHALHFVGHGVFLSEQDRGVLLIERPGGGERRVDNVEFVQLIERRARSLRFAFLSACQTAVAPRNEGYADLGARLLESGLGAAVAMQYSVLNRSAMAFGGAFYKGIADGDPIDAALTEARGALHREGLNTVDFATPVLYLADPCCLRVDPAALRRRAPQAVLDLTGLTPAQRFVGRSAELRELQTHLDPHGVLWRAAVIHGLGGMGKTVLAARLAERMGGSLAGAKAIRMEPTTTAQQVLDLLGDYLLVNNARFNHPQIPEFHRVKGQAVSLESKAAALIEVLCALPLLLILDNYEDVLPEGRAVSRASQSGELEGAAVGLDPDLGKLVGLLVAGVGGPSRFLFTSRVDFQPADEERLGAAVGHLALSEMGFMDAVYLMETLPPLDALPVAVVEEARPGLPPVPRALSQRDVYERLGGHPYTLALFAGHARRSTAEAVLADLAGVQQDLLAFTLLDRAAVELPERAGELLRRAAIYDEAAPEEGLAFLLGDERDAMPPVGDEVRALLGWGLLARPPGETTYAVPTPVRTWARAGMSGEERGRLSRRAAEFWYAMGVDSHSLGDHLRARHYWFLAGEYGRAGEIANAATGPLLRWGQIELLLRLLNESVRTLDGNRRAVILSNLATVYMSLGEIAAAREIYERVLAEFESQGAPHQVASVLSQLGTLYKAQGEYGTAQERYEQSLAISQEQEDRTGVAINLHNLGILHQLQGEYKLAQERYEASLAIFRELGDQAAAAACLNNLGILQQVQGRNKLAQELFEASLTLQQELGNRIGMAQSLNSLGMLNQSQGEYEPAREQYEQALTITQELGNRAGMAISLHNLGILHQLQGEYRPARERYEQALAIKQELGDRAGAARSLHQLGMLHQEQGEVGLARERYEQALATAQELGDRAGAANTLGQLGKLYELQGEHGSAREKYERALAIARDLGDRIGMARSLHGLGNLHQLQGEHGPARRRYEQALAIAKEVGDQVGVASSLHELGVLYEKEDEYAQAVQYAAQAFIILQQLGSPDRGVAGHTLARLQEKMGEEAFQVAVQEAGISAASIPAGDSGGQAMTAEQALPVILSNTVAVLTTVQERKEEWWQALEQIQAQASESGDKALSTLLGVLRRLVEGAAATHLASDVPEAYRQVWEDMVRGLSEEGQGD